MKNPRRVIPIEVARAILQRADASVQARQEEIERLNRLPHHADDSVWVPAARAFTRALAHRSALRVLLSFRPQFKVDWLDGTPNTTVTPREGA